MTCHKFSQKNLHEQDKISSLTELTWELMSPMNLTDLSACLVRRDSVTFLHHSEEVEYLCSWLSRVTSPLRYKE